MIIGQQYVRTDGDTVETWDIPTATYARVVAGTAVETRPFTAVEAELAASWQQVINDRAILGAISDGIASLRTMQAQAATLVAESNALRDSTATAPATYSAAALNQVIAALRGVAARQSMILRALSGEVMDDLIGLAQLAAREIQS